MEMHDHFTINEKNLDVNWQKKFQDHLMTVTVLILQKNYKYILLIWLKFNNQSELPKGKCSLVTDI